MEAESRWRGVRMVEVESRSKWSLGGGAVWMVEVEFRWWRWSLDGGGV